MAHLPGSEDAPLADPIAPEPGQRIPIPFHPPLWTYLFLGLNVLIWMAMSAAGGSENPRILLLFGAKYHRLIVAGQYWRLITANFLHIGVVHLLFNSYALYLFGLQMERFFGRTRFFALYMLAGIGGTVLSYAGSRSLSAGASGAIFGLVGATIVYFATYRAAFGHQGRRQFSSLLLITGFNLVWGFVNPGIDNLGHIGGLLMGLALGWAYCPRYQIMPDLAVGLSLQDRYSKKRAALVTLAAGLALGALTLLGTLIHSRPGGPLW